MNEYYKLFLGIAISVFSFNFSFAIPPTFNMTFRSIVHLSNATTGADSVIQFDIFMLWTNSTVPGVDPFEYGSNQLNIMFNPAIANGGTLAASRVLTGLPPGSLTGPLATPSVQIIPNPQWSGTMLFQGSSIIPQGANNFFISDVYPGTCIGRFKIRTTAHQFANVTPNMRWQLTPPNNTFPAYMLPPSDPDDPDNQLAAALMDTINNYYVDPGYVFTRPPGAEFSANKTIINTGSPVIFSDNSYQPESWSWSFPGGTPSTSIVQDPPEIVYNTPGIFPVTLTVTNPFGSSTKTKNNYITVTDRAIVNLKIIYEGYYDPGKNRLNKKDTVRAYLRQAAAPYGFVDSSKSIIDSVNFTGTFIFNNSPSGIYYVVPIHRNGLEVWSKSGGEAVAPGTSVIYDFTSALSQTFGNNSIQIGSKYCAYSGDVVKDGGINLNDITAIFTDATLFNNGYLVTDLNGDNSVKLQDILIAYNNSTKFVVLIRP